MDPMRFFPRADGLERTQEAWILDPLPHPRFDLACPVCKRGSTRFGTVMIRGWKYHDRQTKHANQDRTRRCDVSFKCIECSAVWVHGLVVTERHYQERAQERRDWHWRLGMQMIAEAYGVGGLRAPS